VFEGAVEALQDPLQVTLPTVVIPQRFCGEVQDAPKPNGFEGTPTLQEPFTTIP
jgi:hypothetical protein